MFDRAIVIGCPGAGKSTFSRALQERTRLPLYHLDLLWHRPDRTTIPKAEFDARLNAILSTDRWILDGNYHRTLELRFRACDTVFLLDLPVEVCLAGAEARAGTVHSDLPWVETELDGAFRQWILDFPRDELPVIYGLIDRYRSEKAIHIFRSRDDIQAYLEKISS